MTGNYSKKSNGYVGKLVSKSGILHLNSKVLLSLFILMIIAINSNIATVEAQIFDKYAIAENSDIENAFGNMALSQLLNLYTHDAYGKLYFDGGTLQTVQEIVEILEESGTVSLLNDSIHDSIVNWVFDKMVPLVDDWSDVEDSASFVDNFITSNESATGIIINEPVKVEREPEILVKYWWGNTKQSVIAGKILKDLNMLSEEIITDLMTGMRRVFNETLPVFSLTHKDFPNVYDAFVLAYEYELFDLFDEYTFPKLNEQANIDLESQGEDWWNPLSLEDIKQEYNTNLTYHEGYELNQQVFSGQTAKYKLLTLDDWFNNGLDTIIPYQEIILDWIPTDIPNKEDLESSVEIGLVDKIFVNNTYLEKENNTGLLESLQSEHDLLPVFNETNEIVGYSYYEWNSELLWYEMIASLSDEKTDDTIIEKNSYPNIGNIVFDLDLIDNKGVKLDLLVRQCLHESTIKWDNMDYSKIIEGFKNETTIKFMTNDEYRIEINESSKSIKISYNEEETLIDEFGNKTVVIVEKVEVAQITDEIVVIEINNQLHTLEYSSPFIEYTIPYNVSVQTDPLFYGIISKNESKTEQFITGDKSKIDGGMYSWPVDSEVKMDDMRTSNIYKISNIIDGFGVTNQRQADEYHVLIYPVNKTSSTNYEQTDVNLKSQIVNDVINPAEKYMVYFPLLNESISEFQLYDYNISKLDITWSKLGNYIDITRRIIDDISFQSVYNTYPILDLMFACQNESTKLFQDDIRSTYEAWSRLYKMGYFESLVSDEEVRSVYEKLMNEFYIEEYEEYTLKTTGETSYILNKAGFGEIEWTTRDTLYGLKLLKFINNRLNVPIDGIKPALGHVLDIGVYKNYPVKLNPQDLPHYGLLWKGYQASQDSADNYLYLSIRASMQVQTEFQNNYQVSYEEIYKKPKFALSKKSILLPDELMFWNEEQIDNNYLLRFTIELIIQLGVVFTGVFLGTNLGGNKRGVCLSLFVGVLISIQAIGVPFVSTGGTIDIIAKQFALIGKTVNFLEDKLYEFSHKLTTEITYERNIFNELPRTSTAVPCYNTKSIDIKIEDKSIDARYDQYLIRERNKRINFMRLTDSPSGITVPEINLFIGPLNYNDYVFNQVNSVLPEEINQQVNDKMVNSEKILEELKYSLLATLGSLGRSALSLNGLNDFLNSPRNIVSHVTSLGDTLDALKRFQEFRKTSGADGYENGKLAGDMKLIFQYEFLKNEYIKDVTEYKNANSEVKDNHLPIVTKQLTADSVKILTKSREALQNTIKAIEGQQDSVAKVTYATIEKSIVEQLCKDAGMPRFSSISKLAKEINAPNSNVGNRLLGLSLCYDVEIYALRGKDLGGNDTIHLALILPEGLDIDSLHKLMNLNNAGGLKNKTIIATLLDRTANERLARDLYNTSKSDSVLKLSSGQDDFVVLYIGLSEGVMNKVPDMTNELVAMAAKGAQITKSGGGVGTLTMVGERYRPFDVDLGLDSGTLFKSNLNEQLNISRNFSEILDLQMKPQKVVSIKREFNQNMTRFVEKKEAVFFTNLEENRLADNGYGVEGVKLPIEFVKRLSDIAREKAIGTQGDIRYIFLMKKINDLFKTKSTSSILHENVNTTIYATVWNMIYMIAAEGNFQDYEKLGETLSNHYQKASSINLGSGDLKIFVRGSSLTSYSTKNLFLKLIFDHTKLVFGDDTANTMFLRALEAAKSQIRKDTANKKSVGKTNDYIIQNENFLKELSTINISITGGYGSEGIDLVYTKKQFSLFDMPDGSEMDVLSWNGKYDLSVHEWKKKTLDRGRVSPGKDMKFNGEDIVYDDPNHYPISTTGNVPRNAELPEGDNMPIIEGKQGIFSMLSMIGIYLNIPFTSKGGLLEGLDIKERKLWNEIQTLRGAGVVELKRGLISDTQAMKGCVNYDDVDRNVSTMVFDFTGMLYNRNKLGNTYDIGGSYDVLLMGAVQLGMSRFLDSNGNAKTDAELKKQFITNDHFEKAKEIRDNYVKFSNKFTVDNDPAVANKFLGEFFKDFWIDNSTDYGLGFTLFGTSSYKGWKNPITNKYELHDYPYVDGPVSAFWNTFLNGMRFAINNSPTINSLSSNFLLNGIDENYLPMNDKITAITQAYYEDNGYIHANINGEGYIQGAVEDSNVTLIKSPIMTSESMNLNWGTSIAELNKLLSWIYPADELLSGTVAQIWNNSTKSFTFDYEGELEGLPADSTIVVDKEDHTTIPETAIMSLAGSNILLDSFPVVKWVWRNAPSCSVFDHSYVRSSSTTWNQGEVVFTVKNSSGDTYEIGFMTTSQRPGYRVDGDWENLPDVKLYLDPITLINEYGHLNEDGSVTQTSIWESNYITEQVNLYEIAKDKFLSEGKTADNLELIEMSLGCGDFYVYTEGGKDHETLFGPFEFSADDTDLTASYHQAVVKTFYKEYTETDGEISLADEELYINNAKLLAVGGIDGTSYTGLNNAQEWLVEVKKQDIYDEFAEFIGHGLVLIKNSDYEYIGMFNQSYSFPEDSETLNAPRWTRIPQVEMIPIYVYYDATQNNGWNDQLWYTTATTLTNQLTALGKSAIIVTELDLISIMNDVDTRSIVVMMGSIPSSLMGYIDPDKRENTSAIEAVAMIEDHTVIEKYLNNGGCLISAGPFGGLRAVSYPSLSNEIIIGDYRDDTIDFPVDDAIYLEIEAELAEILGITDTTVYGSSTTAKWMKNNTNDINNYYSTGLYIPSTLDDRVLEVYNYNGSQKDVALKVGRGIFINYHTADDNSGEGRLNFTNAQGFIDDIATIINGKVNSGYSSSFTPNTRWLPSNTITTNTPNTQSAIDYPNLVVTMEIEPEWRSLDSTMREYYNFSGSSHQTESTVKVEGETSTKFTYNLVTDESPDLVQSEQLSTNDFTDRILDNLSIVTLAVKPILTPGSDLDDTEITIPSESTIYDLDILTKPDIWTIVFTIVDGTGISKKLYYYHSFKMPQFYRGNLIEDLPTDYTQYWDTDSDTYERISNISDGNANDSNRFVRIGLVNNEWNRLGLNLISDFNKLFVTNEKEITVTNVDICYSAATFVENSTNYNYYYLDDFTFLSSETTTSEEYIIRQDYTDGINIYRYYKVITSKETVTLDGVARESGDLWMADGDPYDYAVCEFETVSQRSDYATDGSTPSTIYSTTLNGIDIFGGRNGLLYYRGDTVYTSSTQGSSYVIDKNLIQETEILTLSSTRSYRPTYTGTSLYLKGSVSNSAVSHNLNYRIKDYNEISLEIRVIDDNNGSPIKIKLEDKSDSDVRYIELSEHNYMTTYHFNILDFKDTSGTQFDLYTDEVDKLVIEVGVGEIMIDNIIIRGSMGTYLDDSFDFGSTNALSNSNYANFSLAGAYLSNWGIYSGSFTTENYKVTAPCNNHLDSSPIVMDLSDNLTDLFVSVEGTGDFTLKMDIYDEDGDYSDTIVFAEKTLSGWGYNDEIRLSIPATYLPLEDGERFLGNPVLTGNGSMIFNEITNISNNYTETISVNNGSSIVKTDYFSLFNDETDELLWTENITEYINYVDNGNQSIYWQKPSTVDQTNGNTIEFRVRIRENSYGSEGSFVVYIYDGDDMYIVSVSGNHDSNPDRVMVESGDYSKNYWTNSGAFRATEWHTYRIVTLDENIWVYVNGFSIGGPWSTNRDASGLNSIRFGSLWSGSYTNIVDVDYFYNAQGEDVAPPNTPFWDHKLDGDSSGVWTLTNGSNYEVTYSHNELEGNSSTWSVSNGDFVADTTSSRKSLNINKEEYENITVVSSFEFDRFDTISEFGYIIRYQDSDNYARVTVYGRSGDWEARLTYVNDGTTVTIIKDLITDPVADGTDYIMTVDVINELVVMYLNGIKYDLTSYNTTPMLTNDGYFGLYIDDCKVELHDFYIREYDGAVNDSSRGLIANYSFEVDNSVTSFDSSGFRNHGLINGLLSGLEVLSYHSDGTSVKMRDDVVNGDIASGNLTINDSATLQDALSYDLVVSDRYVWGNSYINTLKTWADAGAVIWATGNDTTTNDLVISKANFDPPSGYSPTTGTIYDIATIITGESGTVINTSTDPNYYITELQQDCMPIYYHDFVGSSAIMGYLYTPNNDNGGSLFFDQFGYVTDSSNNYSWLRRMLNWQLDRNNLQSDGIINNGYYFDGSISNYVELPIEVMDGLEDFSITFWVNSVDLAKEYNFVIHGTDIGGNNLAIALTSSTIYAFLGTDTETETYTFSENTWYHIAVTRIGSTLYYYVNGTSVGNDATNSTIIDTDGGVIIGQDQDNISVGPPFHGFNANQALEGWLDELQIYNRALSLDEISMIYNNDSIIRPKITDHEPIAQYDMNRTKNPDYIADTDDQPEFIVFNEIGDNHALVAKESDMYYSDYNNAFYFDGINDNMIASSEEARNSDVVSLSVWHKLGSNFVNNGAPISLMTDTGSSDADGFWWHIGTTNNNILVRVEDNGGEQAYTIPSITTPTGEWIHDIWIISSDRIQWYRNGLLEWTQFTTFNWSSLNTDDLQLRIGQGYYTSYLYKGYIGQVKIWNNTLSSDEVLGEYTNGQIINIIPEGIEYKTDEYPLGHETEEWSLSTNLTFNDDYPADASSLTTFTDNFTDGIDAAWTEDYWIGPNGSSSWDATEVSDQLKIQCSVKGTANETYGLWQEDLNIEGDFDISVDVYRNDAYWNMMGVQIHVYDDNDVLMNWLCLYDAWASSAYDVICYSYDSNGDHEPTHSYRSGHTYSYTANRTFTIERVDGSLQMYENTTARGAAKTSTRTVGTVLISMYNRPAYFNAAGYVRFDNFSMEYGTETDPASLMTLTMDDDSTVDIGINKASNNTYSITANTTEIGTFTYAGITDTFLSLPLDHYNRNHDLSDNENDGVVIDATWQAEGLYFDGVDDRVDIPFGEDYDVGLHDLSISMWIKPDSTTSNLMCLSFGTSTDRAYLGHYNDKWGMGIKDSNWSDAVTTVAEGAWTHLVMVFNSTDNNAKLYVNGEYSYTKNYTDYDLYANLKLGVYGDNTYDWKGYIGNVEIKDRILNEREILSMSKEMYIQETKSSDNLSINLSAKDGELFIIASDGGEVSLEESVSLSSSIVKQVTVGDSESTGGLMIAGFNFGKSSEAYTGIIDSDGITINKLIPISNISDPLNSGNTITGIANLANDFLGYEIDLSRSDISDKYLIVDLIVGTELPYGNSFLVIEDGIQESYSWGTVKNSYQTNQYEKVNQYESIVENQLTRIIIPSIKTSFINIKVVNDEWCYGNLLSLTVNKITLADIDEMKGMNTSAYVQGSSDRGISQYDGVFTLFDIGLNQDSTESKWEIDVLDYSLSKECMLDFSFRLDSRDADEEVIAKFGIHTSSGWYDMDLGKRGQSYSYSHVYQYSQSQSTGQISEDPHIYPTSDRTDYRYGEESSPYFWYSYQSSTAQSCAIDFLQNDHPEYSSVYWAVECEIPQGYMWVYKTTKTTNNAYSINDINLDDVPDMINSWIDLSIPVYDFFEEYYGSQITGTVDKIRLIINENSQNCKFGLSVGEIEFYELNSLASALTLGQDLTSNMKDAASGLAIKEWLASPFYPLEAIGTEGIPKINMIKNGSFSEYTYNSGSISVSNWSFLQGGGQAKYIQEETNTFIEMQGHSTMTPYVRQTIYPRNGDYFGGTKFKVSLDAKLSQYSDDDIYAHILTNVVGDAYIYIPGDTYEWTRFETIFDPSYHSTFLTISLQSGESAGRVYWDNVKVEAIGSDSPSTDNSDIYNLRSIDANKTANGGINSRFAFMDGWYNVYESSTTDYVGVISDVSSSGKEEIADNPFVQYYYTDILINQNQTITNGWVLNIDELSSTSGLWHLWINGEYKGVDDDGDWSNNLTFVEGRNAIQLAYVNNSDSNTDIKFKIELDAPSSGIKFANLPPKESRTRQMSIFYDPQYQSKWITRISDPTTTNIEESNGDNYSRDKKLILDLPLNEGEGVCAMDTSYNGNNSATWVSTTWNEQGIYFDGSNDYIEISDNSLLKPTEITVSAWIRLDENANTTIRHIFLCKWDGYSFELEANTMKPYFRITAGGDSPKPSTGLTKGVWYHLVGTYKPGVGNSLYVNGELIGTTYDASAITHSTNPLHIGKYRGGIYFDGNMKNVQIWNYPLNETEVVQAMNGTHYDPVEDNVNAIKESLCLNALSMGMPATVMNANRLEQYMKTENNMYARTNNEIVWHPFGQILSATDVLPAEIWDGSPNDSLIEKYLEQGGKLVWPGGYPMFGIKADKAESFITDVWSSTDSYQKTDDYGDMYYDFGSTYLSAGWHEIEWEYWDNDSTDEIRLEFRKTGQTTIYVSAQRTGGDKWFKESGDINIPVMGTWDIFARDTGVSTNHWGTRNPKVGKSYNYIGEVNYQYPGALGHQRILDIDTENNDSNPSRSDFAVGIIAYDPNNAYIDDDYNGQTDDVINNDYYPGAEQSDNYELIKYDILGANNPAFTQSSWSGLPAHMILGKHEFDSESRYQYQEFYEWKVVNIDGSSGSRSSYDIGHADPEDPDSFTWIYEDYCSEKGTDPIDMGLWFKPYLADTNGSIEEGIFENDPDNYYLKTETGTYYKYYHHELWNVGTGSIQAGTNGRGIISVLPMYDWDDTDLPLSGVQVKAGKTTIGSSHSEYGLYSNRGSGGVVNTPSTRDYIVNNLALATGTMMFTMALDNIMVNALRDNDTTANNLLNPQFSDNLPQSKYPYDSTGEMSIRHNAGYGHDYDGEDGIGEEEKFMNYPIYTGTYNKWLFVNDVNLPTQDNAYANVYKTYAQGGPAYTGESISDLVYQNNNLITSVALETGGYGSGSSLNPHPTPQYLSLENISISGTSSYNELVTGVTSNSWNGSNLYGASKTAANGTEYNFGTRYVDSNTDTHIGGTESSSNIIEWSTYPTEIDSTDSLQSEAVYLSSIVDSSGFSSLINFNDDMQREMITRGPTANIYNNQNGYERGIGPGFIGEDLAVMRGRGILNTSNYGAILPWSYSSVLLLDDNYTSDYIDTSYASSYWTHNTNGSPLSWYYDSDGDMGPPEENERLGYFNSDKLRDIKYVSNKGGNDFSTGDPIQWLSTGSSDIASLSRTVLGDDSSVDIIRITPAMNCQFYCSNEDYDNWLKVEQIKTLKVTLLDGLTVLKPYYLDFQEWQTTDFVLVVNSYQDAEHAVIPDEIQFQILEVWDSSYGGFDYNESTDDLMIYGDADSNFGGIAEVVLYGKSYATETYAPLSSKFSPFSIPEEGYRFPDMQSNKFIDGGTYWEEDGNEGFNRSMNGGSYNLYISASRDDTEDIGSLRYNCSYMPTVQAFSTEFTPEFIGYWQEQYAIQEQLQMVQSMFMVLSLAFVVIIAALTAGVGAMFTGVLAALGGAGISAISFVGWGVVLAAAGSAAMSTAGVLIVFLGAIQVVGLISPEVSAFLTTMYFQMTDIIAGGLISVFCQVLDTIITPAVMFFNPSILDVNLFRRNLQPLLYQIYMMTLDFKGSAPRLITQSIMSSMDVDPDLLEYMMYDPYERALLAGETYNFLDFGAYFDQGDPPI